MLNSSINLSNYNQPANQKFLDISMQQKKQQNKQVNFTSSVKSGLFKKSADFLIDGLDKTLTQGLDQTSANIINYGGKALLPPLMILAGSHFSHEDKDSIKYSMLMHPIKAVLSLATAVGASFVGNVFIDKAAKKGMLGEFFKNTKNVKELKNISTVWLTLLSLPISAKILGWALPKVMKKVDGITDKDSSKLNLYAQRIKDNMYAQKIKPEFGYLTGFNAGKTA